MRLQTALAYVDTHFANQALQSDNLDDALQARSVTVIAAILKRYDTGGGIGGPIKILEDLLMKLWTNARPGVADRHPNAVALWSDPVLPSVFNHGLIGIGPALPIMRSS